MPKLYVVVYVKSVNANVTAVSFDVDGERYEYEVTSGNFEDGMTSGETIGFTLVDFTWEPERTYTILVKAYGVERFRGEAYLVVSPPS